MHRLARFAFLIACFFTGCKNEPEGKIIYVPNDDKAMSAAIDKARATNATFIAALEKPAPGQSSFSVKVGFVDGKKTEHMWLSPVRFDGKAFQGVVNNQPESVKNVKMGQTVSIEPLQISDWMFVEDGKLKGGYTIRALRDRLQGNERDKFDRGVPFVID